MVLNLYYFYAIFAVNLNHEQMHFLHLPNPLYFL